MEPHWHLSTVLLHISLPSIQTRTSQPSSSRSKHQQTIFFYILQKLDLVSRAKGQLWSKDRERDFCSLFRKCVFNCTSGRSVSASRPNRSRSEYFHIEMKKCRLRSGGHRDHRWKKVPFNKSLVEHKFLFQQGMCWLLAPAFCHANCCLKVKWFLQLLALLTCSTNC